MARLTVAPMGVLRRWTRRLGLRARVTLAFGLLSLVLSLVVSLATYIGVRSYLVGEQESASRRQAYANARVARSTLRARDADIPALLASLRSNSTGAVLLRFRGEWFSSSVSVQPDEIPAGLREAVERGDAGHQKYRSPDGARLAVGVPVAAADAGYFELVQLDALERTLEILATALGLAAGVATAGAVLLGRWMSRRVISPVRRVAEVARGIAAGEFDARLRAEGDADLAPLIESFNEMVDTLSDRIQREARFASDVSHEVRAPLAALSAAVDVVQRRRDQLPDAAVLAMSALETQVRDFTRLVLDLLEISRFDAGTARLETARVDVADLAKRVLAEQGLDGVPVEVTRGVTPVVEGDARRLERVLANLVENACRYGGGPLDIRIDGNGRGLQIAVEDAGPGVPDEEKASIFERFARGEAAEVPEAPRGTGLGLAIVAEHARLHGGRAWVEDRPGGGARFLVELPGRAA